MKRLQIIFKILLCWVVTLVTIPHLLPLISKHIQQDVIMRHKIPTKTSNMTFKGIASQIVNDMARVLFGCLKSSNRIDLNMDIHIFGKYCSFIYSCLHEQHDGRHIWSKTCLPFRSTCYNSWYFCALSLVFLFSCINCLSLRHFLTCHFQFILTYEFEFSLGTFDSFFIIYSLYSLLSNISHMDFFIA